MWPVLAKVFKGMDDIVTGGEDHFGTLGMGAAGVKIGCGACSEYLIDQNVVSFARWRMFSGS